LTKAEISLIISALRRKRKMRKIGASIIVVLLFSSLFMFASAVQPVRAQGTIYIRADGSIDPSTANITTSDNITYTFTGNNYLPIVVQRSNIIIDGGGYTLQASENENGFSLSGLSNVTIRKTTITNCYDGINLESSNGNILSGNNVTGNSYCGIGLYSSSNNTVSGNNATANGYYGIYLRFSSNNTISGNNATANGYDGIQLYFSSYNTVSGNNATANIDPTRTCGNGILLWSSSNNTVSGNNATANSWNGIFLWSHSDENTLSGNYITANGALGGATTGGILLMATCFSNTITGNKVYASKVGAIKLYDLSSYNIISGNNISGGNDLLEVWNCPDNLVVGNTVSQGNWNNILVAHTRNVTVIGNTCTESGIHNTMWPEGSYGISIENCWNITVRENNATANRGSGVYFSNTTDSTVIGNNLIGNYYSGIEFYEPFVHNNRVTSNRIENNTAGLRFVGAQNNIIYHNDFVNNSVQVSIDSASTGNTWNDAYPSGGNYWSDHIGVDEKSGPYQNVTGSDGIIDTPYIIDSNNRDSYPLMSPYQYWSNPIPGDINRDTEVDEIDLSQLGIAYGSTSNKPNWNPNCDLNLDDIINTLDLFLVGKNYGNTGS
jgi:parallel beta-helix repeat protein